MTRSAKIYECPVCDHPDPYVLLSTRGAKGQRKWYGICGNCGASPKRYRHKPREARLAWNEWAYIKLWHLKSQRILNAIIALKDNGFHLFTKGAFEEVKRYEATERECVEALESENPIGPKP